MIVMLWYLNIYKKITFILSLDAFYLNHEKILNLLIDRDELSLYLQFEILTSSPKTVPI